MRQTQMGSCGGSIWVARDEQKALNIQGIHEQESAGKGDRQRHTLDLPHCLRGWTPSSPHRAHSL
jgi:hypothetical protein